MSILVTILLVLLALLAAMVIAVVAVPWQARAAGELSDDSVYGAVVGSWGFGLVGIRLATQEGASLLLCGRPVWRIRPDSEETKAKKKAKKAEKRRKKKAKKKPSKKTARDWLRFGVDHNPTMRRLVWRILRTFKLRLRLEGTVGFDDPADTAVLIVTMQRVGRLSDAARIDVEPDYLDDTVDLAGEVSARLWILAMLWVGLISLFEVRTWKMLRALT